MPRVAHGPSTRRENACAAVEACSRRRQWRSRGGAGARQALQANAALGICTKLERSFIEMVGYMRCDVE